MSLVGLLRADAERQLHFAGVRCDRVGALRLLRMLPSPRFVPVVLYRVAYWCATHHLRPAAKAFSLLNFVLFGLEIGIDCEIGAGLYLPHTSGTVIGARRIGKNAVIYHNVTIGAKELDLAYDPKKRPEVLDEVLLAAGAKVLGGITIGNRVVVAANAVVLDSIPDGALVGGVPGRIIRQDRQPAY